MGGGGGGGGAVRKYNLAVIGEGRGRAEIKPVIRGGKGLHEI